MVAMMVSPDMAAKRISRGMVVFAVAVVLVAGGAPMLAPAAGHDAPATADGPAVDSQEYNVTFSSTTIGELVLRNVTVRNVKVREVTVDEMTVGNETSEDVELENVSLARLDIERAVVTDVSTGELSVRNKSILDVPGGELIGNAGDRSLDRHVVDNLTITGVEIQRLHVGNLTVETEIEAIEGDVEAQPEEGPDEPDVSIGEADAPTASVTNASFREGAVESASVEDETVTPETEKGGNGSDGEDGDGEDGGDEGDGDDGDDEGAMVSARTGR
jgi:hypothetical protein